MLDHHKQLQEVYRILEIAKDIQSLEEATMGEKLQ